MTKLTLVALALLTIGVVLWAGYASQGSYVDENGVLQEPFALLAFGWFFVLAGGAVLGGVVGIRIFKNLRGPK
ncbi:hypothetical protein Ga0609869_001984 [Rhodovulum iodosum]|uniref:DUF3955 domain-containing protein n=1 Tax=Rhodovulum iodosum TaxID=68291 RepID=A0ABV3XTG3_9RHOB|nr:DUF3955 domain-containing protein [Rhodovulum robiginosum]RSK32088.1 DUF3955 domain-containing protein [Rhodovulum robiginosum]